MVRGSNGSVKGVGLLAKLALIGASCFLLSTAIGVYWLTEVEIGKARDALANRISLTAERVAETLAQHGRRHHDGDPDSILQEELFSLLLADQAIRCVELVDDRAEGATPTGPVVASVVASAVSGCRDRLADMSLEFPVSIGAHRTLAVHVSTEEIEAAVHAGRRGFIQILCIGLLIAILSSFAGFTLLIGRPLGELLDAMRRRRETGQPALIETGRRDEIGVLMNTFDDLQVHLDKEADAQRADLAKLDRIYKTTPALLCSCDAEGAILSVSDHFAAMAGVARDDLLGQPIEQFLRSPSTTNFRDKVLAPCLNDGKALNVPLNLASATGRPLDILLSAAPDRSIDGELTIFCVMSDISPLKTAERRLQKLALTDPLTGLPNRRGLVEHLGRAMHRGRDAADDSITAVLFIDLDNFKWINDTYGHEAGDALLIEAGDRIRLCVRVNDFIARLGGDEFAIVCYRVESPKKVEEVAERIIRQLKQPFQFGATQGVIGASVGIAYVDPAMDGPDSILKLADMAMYDAKQHGKSCHRTYRNELKNKALTTDTLRQQIASGLEKGGFSLVYQPIIDLATETPVGAEALLRLTCPKFGMIPPDAFIPVAEETGQIHELGAWVIEQGVESLTLLDGDAGGSTFSIALNASSRQLNDSLIDSLNAMFSRHPHARGRLILEITESALLQRGDRVADLLGAIRDTGVRIALDDFGTGFSSLSHVHEFPVDILKIDRSFVCGLGAGEHDAMRRQMAMIRATSSMAQELGITVIAEGIESAATSRILLDCGVTLGQGYLFSPPMLPEAFKDWLLDHGAGPTPPFEAMIRENNGLREAH